MLESTPLCLPRAAAAAGCDAAGVQAAVSHLFWSATAALHWQSVPPPVERGAGRLVGGSLGAAAAQPGRGPVRKITAGCGCCSTCGCGNNIMEFVGM
jgi:hypothetical protein